MMQGEQQVEPSRVLSMHEIDMLARIFAFDGAQELVDFAVRLDHKAAQELKAGETSYVVAQHRF